MVNLQKSKLLVQKGSFSILNGPQLYTDWKKWIPHITFVVYERSTEQKPKWTPRAWYGQNQLFSYGRYLKFFFFSIGLLHPGNSKKLVSGLWGVSRGLRGHFDPFLTPKMLFLPIFYKIDLISSLFQVLFSTLLLQNSLEA